VPKGPWLDLAVWAGANRVLPVLSQIIFLTAPLLVPRAPDASGVFASLPPFGRVESRVKPRARARVQRHDRRIMIQPPLRTFMTRGRDGYLSGGPPSSHPPRFAERSKRFDLHAGLSSGTLDRPCRAPCYVIGVQPAIGRPFGPKSRNKHKTGSRLPTRAARGENWRGVVALA
jgi:hypothetical protein